MTDVVHATISKSSFTKNYFLFKFIITTFLPIRTKLFLEKRNLPGLTVGLKVLIR